MGLHSTFFGSLGLWGLSFLGGISATCGIHKDKCGFDVVIVPNSWVSTPDILLSLVLALRAIRVIPFILSLFVLSSVILFS